jgi:hypothetical protein
MRVSSYRKSRRSGKNNQTLLWGFTPTLLGLLRADLTAPNRRGSGKTGSKLFTDDTSNETDVGERRD